MVVLDLVIVASLQVDTSVVKGAVLVVVMVVLLLVSVIVVVRPLIVVL